ncbi:MAG: hypothetical protein ABH871_05055 [Pseudomonadota bacterium]
MYAAGQVLNAVTAVPISSMCAMGALMPSNTIGMASCTADSKYVAMLTSPQNRCDSWSPANFCSTIHRKTEQMMARDGRKMSSVPLAMAASVAGLMTTAWSAEASARPDDFSGVEYGDSLNGIWYTLPLAGAIVMLLVLSRLSNRQAQVSKKSGPDVPVADNSNGVSSRRLSARVDGVMISDIPPPPPPSVPGLRG